MTVWLLNSYSPYSAARPQRDAPPQENNHATRTFKCESHTHLTDQILSKKEQKPVEREKGYGETSGVSPALGPLPLGL